MEYLWNIVFGLLGFIIVWVVCIRLNPMWIQTTKLFDQYCVTGRSNVVYYSHMNSLDQYRRYSTPDGADKWLKRLIKQGNIDIAFVIDRLSMNTILQEEISAQLKDILSSHAAPFSRSVSKLIIRKRMPMIWTTYPSELQVIISYTSPAGRNRYTSSYVWNARELQRLVNVTDAAMHLEDQNSQLRDEIRYADYYSDSVQLKPAVRSVVIHQSSPTTNGIMLDGLASEVDVDTTVRAYDTYATADIDTDASDSEVLSMTTEVRSNDNAETIFGGLYAVDSRWISPKCLTYLQTYRAYTSEEYRKRCAHNGKKRIPGCYIIYNTVTQQVYVGQAVDIMRRVQEHLNGKRSGGERLDYDIAILNHRVLIKHVLLSESGYLDLNELERDLIRACDCVEPKGYNKTRGNGY